MHRSAWFMVAAFSLVVGSARTARACSPRPRSPSVAMPRPGATDVSPIGSLYLSSHGGLPAGLTIEANGQVQPLPAIRPLGGGPDGTWWKIEGEFLPGASYVVRVSGSGPATELTHFTTATAYDKMMGAPPKLDGLRLWRVRYPVSAIAAGGCVFAEYEGYVDLDYQPPALPGTPPDEVINILTLAPKNGGVAQQLVWSGSARLGLAATENGMPPADGQLPSPAQSNWKVELSPDREYCASLQVYGRGIFSALPADSNLVCAMVKSASAPGASADVGGSGADPGSGSGCGVGRAAGPGGETLLLVAVILLRLRHRDRRQIHPTVH
jgi:hypothetical protein